MIHCLEIILRLAESIISSLFQLRLVLHIVDNSVQRAGLTLVLVSLLPLFTGQMFHKQLFGKCMYIFDLKVFIDSLVRGISIRSAGC